MKQTQFRGAHHTSSRAIPAMHVRDIYIYTHTSISNGLFQKNQGRRGRVEDMEFPGILKKDHVKIPEVD